MLLACSQVVNSVFHLIKPAGPACSEGAARGICRGALHSYGFIKLYLRFPYFKPSSFEDIDDTVKPNALESRFRGYLAAASPVPKALVLFGVRGDHLFVVCVFLSIKS